MQVVGFFTGNVDENLLNKKLFLDEMNNTFFIEGQNIPLSKNIIDTLNRQNIIRWTDINKVESLFKNGNSNTDIMAIIASNGFDDGFQDDDGKMPDFTKKNIHNITLEDYNFALANPSLLWSEYLIGLYFLRNNNKVQAFTHLKNFYTRSPLETIAIKYLLMSKGDPFFEHKPIPNLLPEELEKFTISRKYLNDFLTYNLVDIPMKITRLKVVNFAMTAATVTIFFMAFLSMFILSFK